MKDLSVVIPVYNEEDIIRKVIDDWVETLIDLSIDYELIILNDGSRDSTFQVIASCVERNDRIVLVNKENSGHGPTILEGYKYAMENSKWVFQVDSDNEMKAEYFKEMWSQRNEYDFLVGIRTGRESNIFRKILTFFSRLIVKVFFGGKVQDVNSPYRLFKASCLREVINQIPRDTFAPNILISGLASRLDLNVLNTPVPYNFRETGRVSIRNIKVMSLGLKCFIQSLNYWLSLSRSEKVNIS